MPRRGAFALALLTLALAQSLDRPQVVADFPEDGPFRFTQDGRRLVTLYRINQAQRQTVQVYRLEGTTPVLEDYLWLKPQHYLLAADGTGRRIAVSAPSRCEARPWPSTRHTPDSLGRLELLEFPSGKRLLRLQSQGLCGLTYPVFSPDGRLLAVPNRGGWVQLWDTQSGRLKHTFAAAGRVETVAFSPDGQRLAVCEQGIAVYEVPTRRPVARLSGTGCTGIQPAFTPDGGRLLVADGKNPVGVWNLASGQRERTLPRRAGRGANALALSADGARVLTLDAGRGLSLYDFASGRALFQTDRGGVWLVASPNLEWFATVAPPQLWRLR